MRGSAGMDVTQALTDDGYRLNSTEYICEANGIVQRDAQVIQFPIKSFVVQEEEIDRRKKFLMMKRSFDLIASTVALIALSPIMLLIAIAIFLNDPKGSPIFSQTRVGKDGKEFKFYKFRSMCVNAEEILDQLQDKNEMDGPAFKMKDDPRITKIGKFLRKTSLDELPQLVNIIKGDMSIVGPRPPLPREVEKYNAYHRQRLMVKGGLTCFWQCGGRSNVGFDEWVDMDIKYINQMSFRTDIKIILKTAKAVIRMDGAE